MSSLIPSTRIEEVLKRWQDERTAMLKEPGDDDRYSNIHVSFEVSFASPFLTDEARRVMKVLGILPNGIEHEDLNVLFPTFGRGAENTLKQMGLAFNEGSRLRVLAPLREFVSLRHRPEVEDLKRVISHFVELANRSGPMVGKAYGTEAVERLANETANLEAILIEGLEQEDPKPSIRASCAVTDFIQLSGHGSPRLLEEAQRTARKQKLSLEEADCTKCLGDIALRRSEHDKARKLYSQAQQLYHRKRSSLGEADCIERLADLSLARCAEHKTALSNYQMALTMYRSKKSSKREADRKRADLGEANCIKGEGDLTLRSSKHDKARRKYDEAAKLYSGADSLRGQTNCIERLGDVALSLSDDELARKKYQEASESYRREGSVLGEANCIKGLGEIHLRRSEHVAAQKQYDDALKRYRRVGFVRGIADCMKGLGDVELAERKLDKTQQHYDEARRHYERVGFIRGTARCLRGGGDIAWTRSEWASAGALYREAIKLFRRSCSEREANECNAVLQSIETSLSRSSAQGLATRDE